MKAEKAFAVIGKKLEKEYKRLGFKYFKKYKLLKTGTCTELRVTLAISDRTLLKKNINANSEVVCADLWEMGSHYNIANEKLMNDTFIDLRDKIEDYLLPHIKRPEEQR